MSNLTNTVLDETTYLGVRIQVGYHVKYNEIFFVYDGTMYVADSEEQMYEIIDSIIEERKAERERENLIKSTHITINVDDTKYTFNISAHDRIIKTINRIKDIAERVNMLETYLKLKKEVMGE